jgi:hypothetical protein
MAVEQAPPGATLPVELAEPPQARAVVRAALRTYRERFREVAGSAFLVFGSVAVVDTFGAVLVADDHVSRPIGAAVTSVVTGVLAAAGIVVYAGLLDKLVGAHLHGHEDRPLREVWRTLRIGRLLVADVALAAATVAGLALFVVPGVVVFTMWSLVGPLITIEDRSVRSALGRSWQLVRSNFWLTFGLVTVPLQVEQVVLHAVHYTELFDHPVLPALVVNGVLGAVVGSVVGLIEVVLAYELIAASTPHRSPGSTPRPPPGRWGRSGEGRSSG